MRINLANVAWRLAIFYVTKHFLNDSRWIIWNSPCFFRLLNWNCSSFYSSLAKFGKLCELHVKFEWQQIIEIFRYLNCSWSYLKCSGHHSIFTANFCWITFRSIKLAQLCVTYEQIIDFAPLNINLEEVSLNIKLSISIIRLC